MEIPLFPLHAVCFPGTSLPLQVFEPRYREMMRDVLAADRRFGSIAIRRGMEVGGPAETYEVGCITEITQLQRAPDGTMQMVVEGRRRFAVLERMPDDPYPRARVELLEETDGVDVTAALPAARAAVRRYLSVVAQMSGRDVVVPAIPDDAIGASFIISSIIQLDVPIRQRLLEAPDATTRLLIAAAIAKDESVLLEALGPSVGKPDGRLSLN